jgi:hypothetical protein
MLLNVFSLFIQSFTKLKQGRVQILFKASWSTVCLHFCCIIISCTNIMGLGSECYDEIAVERCSPLERIHLTEFLISSY